VESRHLLQFISTSLEISQNIGFIINFNKFFHLGNFNLLHLTDLDLLAKSIDVLFPTKISLIPHYFSKKKFFVFFFLTEFVLLLEEQKQVPPTVVVL
jgi:hypothetical protein